MRLEHQDVLQQLLQGGRMTRVRDEGTKGPDRGLTAILPPRLDVSAVEANRAAHVGGLHTREGGVIA